MARRSRSNIRLTGSKEIAVIKSEREKAEIQVKHFDRKGLHNTYWHSELARLDAVLKSLVKGAKEDGK